MNNHSSAQRVNDQYHCATCGKQWDVNDQDVPDCKMELISLAPTKTVEYFGLSLTVPEGEHYMATDANGWVWRYINCPVIHISTWAPESLNDCNYIHIATVKLNGINWRETLRKV